jgi:hypothetical protein
MDPVTIDGVELFQFVLYGFAVQWIVGAFSGYLGMAEARMGGGSRKQPRV